MKHYIAQINERCGEYEYSHTIRLLCAGDVEPALKDIAANWYEDEYEYAYENEEPLHLAADVEKGNYYFNCGEVCLTIGAWQEVDKAIFDAMPNFITVFTRS